MKTNKEFKRRDFIKTVAAGTAGLALLGAETTGCAEKDPAPGKAATIISRKLGSTGLELPVISMGVMNATNPNLVKAALEAGIVHLDTAHVYQRGRNEEMVGKVVRDFPRDSFVIATKVGAKKDRNTNMYTEGTSEKVFLDELDSSLKRLQVDYADILYLHNMKVKEAVLYEPAMNALEKAKKAGKIRFTGITTHQNEPEIIQTAIDTKFYEVILTAYTFRQPHVTEVKKAIAKAAQAGLGIVGMKNLAGGYWDRENRKDPINAKAAIKWALQDENMHTVIPGFTTFDQMNEDLSIMEHLPLTEQEIIDLRFDRETGSLYCPGCEKCLAQCPHNLPIPDLMRAYMYSCGYRNQEAAKILVDALELQEGVCEDCDECSVVCASGFNISRKIKNIARLKSVPYDLLA